jgi:hypothetical protein
MLPKWRWLVRTRSPSQKEGDAMILVERLAGWWHGRRSLPETTSTAVIAGMPSDDGPLVQQIAERLRQGDLVAGGWSAEAGALPIDSYVPEARRLVRSIALGGSVEAGPPTP